MTEDSYDIIIPTIEKDMYKIIESIEFINKNLKFKKIIFIGDKRVIQKVKSLKYKNVTYLNENAIYKGLNLDNIKKVLKERINDEKRAGWYFQQFIKMAYATICNDDYYLSWDSDTIPLKKVTMFSENGKPYFDLKTEYHKPYFETIKELFGDEFEKINNNSFISEHMLFKTSLMKEMIAELELSNDLFFYKILKAIKKDDLANSGFSEFETYGTWVSIKYPNDYDYRNWKSLRQGSTLYSFPLQIDDANKLARYYDAITFEKDVNRNKKKIHNGILPLNIYINILIKKNDIIKEVRRRLK